MQEPAISFDTETAEWQDRSKEFLCSLQFGIPSDRSIYLVDLIAITNRERDKEAIALAPFAKVFSSNGPIKVIHWAKFEEFQLLRSGTILENVIDTKLLAKKVLGEGPYGLGKLVERQLGIKIDKARQTGDHSSRPMCQAELDYDALDAEITWRLYEEGLLPLARVMRLDPLKLDWRSQRFHEHEE